MTGWTDDLTPDEREGWDAFVDHFRRDALQKIGGSAVFVSLLPSSDQFDVQFAAELGTAIMLGKPIMVVKMPGVDVPPMLADLAECVVDADPDTEEGRDALQAAFKAMIPDG